MTGTTTEKGREATKAVKMEVMMTRKELKQAAMECLSKAFKGDVGIPSHTVQAAVAILTLPEPKADESGS